MNLIAQKNFLLPDLRFVSTYGITGLGSRLDGPGANNAFRSLSSNQFNNWSLGLQMTMPIGFREAHANVRQARLQLARSYAVLQTQEEKAKRYLAQQYRLLFETYEQIKIQRAQREAAAQQLRARYLEFLAGRGTLDILLEAQRVWADALKAEYDNIVAYNNALAGFEFAKGTIQEYNNITIAEGGLPECGRERAVEHEKRRCIQLLKRERANPIQYAPCANDPTCKARIPELPEDKVPSLPALTDLEELLKRDTETVHAAKAEKTQVIGKEIVQPNATSVVEPTQFETRTPTDNVNPDDQTMKTEPEKNHVAGRRDRRPPAKSEFVLPPIPKGAKMSLPPWEQPDPNQR
ncbi:MAG: hypothetical protein KatS3mg105_2403 [Gemmatales bacterium]|nr:MAG: hypothetical protein KatS3mg105_2403 [Gemmatales bacterium]